MIFAALSESLILGTTVPSSLMIAASLYTPPSAGISAEVMSLVPTPQRSIFAPCCMREEMEYSSRSPDAQMIASENPASSSIFLAFLER